MNQVVCRIQSKRIKTSETVFIGMKIEQFSSYKNVVKCPIQIVNMCR